MIENIYKYTELHTVAYSKINLVILFIYLTAKIMEATAHKTSIRGGEFVIRETKAQDVFIPEEFSEEQKMMAEACQDFIDKEITPNIKRIDSMEEGLMRSIMQKAGGLGLLGISIPEEYDGIAMSFNSSMLTADIIGSSGSFSTTYGAHTGIGTLPILYYGSKEQKQKYLPKLATGEWIGCYCLTEPDAGSDANSGKTKAVLSEDGKYYHITGQKMWISNAGFADLFIVFAKIEDDKNLTAFIVEKNFGSISMNDEEKKLGIKGSSTRQVFFNDCKVPIGNMLSSRQNGFKIAVNILNIGRIKLGIGVIGGCKEIITNATRYAIERKQFGQPIASFGAIQHKIAEMAIRTYAVESAGYRAGQNIDDKVEDLIAQEIPENQAKLKGVEQFAIEAAILKIIGSEALDYIADEGVQIYGGMGFSAEAPMERAYRDARIARIYEGTNEINRILITSMMMKKAMKGELDLITHAMAVAQELIATPEEEILDSSQIFSVEKHTVKNLKKALLMVAGRAIQLLGQNIEHEQEVMINIADMIIEIYTAESMLLRVDKLAHKQGESKCNLQIKAVKVYLYEAVEKLIKAGREAIASFTTSEETKVMLAGLNRFTKTELVNTKALRRDIAEAMIQKGTYAL